MEQIHRAYIITTSNEIYKGLAFEQVLYLYAAKEARNKCEQILCVWKSKPAVVIGRNQNPLIETNYPFLKLHNIDLARRDSGGGTVYQDEHNLNFCFIQKNGKNIEENLQFLQHVLATLGFDCTIDAKNNILYQGKKISGSAFRHGKDIQMHHFTLLLNTDLDRLYNSLHPEHGIRIESVGIDSHRVEVTNVQVSVSEIIQAIQKLDLIDELIYIENDNDLESLHVKEFQKEYNRLKSPEWIFERTPSFSLKYIDDEEEYYISIKKGKIVQIQNALQETLFKGEYYFFLPQKNHSHKINAYSIIEEIIPVLYKKIFGG